MNIGFLIVNAIIALIFTLYFFFIIRRTFNLLKLDKQVKVFLTIALLLIVFIASINFRTFYFIVVVQLVIWYLFFDVIHFFISTARKISQKSFSIRFFHIAYRSSLVPVIIVTALTLYGKYNMTQLHRTEYTVEAEGLSRNYKFLFLSDMHFDTIQEKSVFESKIDSINSEELDFVILGGDICDEGTTAESAAEVFEQISKIKSRYGTFFIYGNHDRQIYSDKPYYSIEEFENMIKENNIRILQDNASIINDDLVLFGREDVSAGFSNKTPRKSVEDFIPEEALCTKYIIVADHQPKKSSVKECLDYRCGLQISGHTHAGQIFPFGLFMKLFGGYVYGKYTEGDENSKIELIVSSGVTGWGYPMRTEKDCEYVIVNLINDEKFTR